jgi:hypothetical protein
VYEALFKVELNLFSPVVCLVFYSSRLNNYTVIQGSTRLVALAWLNFYIVGYSNSSVIPLCRVVCHCSGVM